MEIVCFVFLILEYLIKNCFFVHKDLVVDLLGERKQILLGEEEWTKYNNIHQILTFISYQTHQSF